MVNECIVKVALTTDLDAVGREMSPKLCSKLETDSTKKKRILCERVLKKLTLCILFVAVDRGLYIL